MSNSWYLDGIKKKNFSVGHDLIDGHLNLTAILSCTNVQKELNFTLKVVGGDVSSIPGLSDAIEV